MLSLKGVIFFCILKTSFIWAGEVQGVLQPLFLFEIKAQGSGILEKWHLQEGDMVKKGQNIISLSDEEMKIQLHLAKIDLDASLQKYELKKEVKHALTKQELEELRIDVLRKEENFKLKEIILSKQHVKAPQSGMIHSQIKHLGEYVSSSESIGELIDIQKLTSFIFIPFKEAQKKKKGDKIEIFLPQINQKKEAVIQMMYPTMDAASQSQKIQISVDNVKNEKWLLMPGMNFIWNY